MGKDERFAALDFRDQIKDVVEEIAFDMVQDVPFAKVIAKAVQNNIEISFIPSPDPIRQDEVNIRLRASKDPGVGTYWTQDVFVRIDTIGLVG